MAGGCNFLPFACWAEGREQMTVGGICIWSRVRYWLQFIDPTPAYVSAPRTAILVYCSKNVRCTGIQYHLVIEYYILPRVLSVTILMFWSDDLLYFGRTCDYNIQFTLTCTGVYNDVITNRFLVEFSNCGCNHSPCPGLRDQLPIATAQSDRSTAVHIVTHQP